MAPKRAVFVRFSAFMVAHASSRRCGATLDPASAKGLRFSGFRAPGFSVDDDAANQVVRNR